MNPYLSYKLRGIAVVYLLLFISGLAGAAYFLREILELKPIPMIGLLKYLLLCVLFIVLAINSIKAIGLKPQQISRLYKSTTNFKWLFTIAVLISLTAKLGFFNTPLQKQAVTYLQIGLLLVTAAFCFWSDVLLSKQDIPADDPGTE
jgi:hypothetical protein